MLYGITVLQGGYGRRSTDERQSGETTGRGKKIFVGGGGILQSGKAVACANRRKHTGLEGEGMDQKRGEPSGEKKLSLLF